MTEFRRVQGDAKDTLVAFLYGVAVFAGATAVAHVWADGVAAINLAAAVADGVDGNGRACGVCTVQLGVATTGWLATAAPGPWFIEYEITFADATRITWPADLPDAVVVRPQGA